MEFRIEDRLDELAAVGVFAEPGAVEVVQTHISVVCLVGDRAYKLKKAVRLPFLDFSTADLRERACRDEVRLNRRLCPDVYLGVVPVRWTGAGLRIGDAPPRGGERVDHAVCMVRLPAQRMLDRLLAEAAVSLAEIEDLARLVATFHARARGEADDAVRAAGAPGCLIAQIRANFVDTPPADGRVLHPGLHAALRARVESALPALQAALERRAAGGRIVEGHGDLHARNVCMTSPATIYDCIEFRKDFRCEDVATEVAFMVMDLRFRGHRELADAFADAYEAASGDRGVRDVLPELVRYRAMVRAKVDSIAATEAAIPGADRDRARRAAGRHLRLAAWTRIEDDGPVLLIATGLPASGKSFVLDVVARETGWPLFATDRVRKELAGVGERDRLPPACYGPDWSDRTYHEAIRRASATPGSSIVDGNFPDPARRRLAVERATASGKRAYVVHVAVAPSLARRRLRARANDGQTVSDADEAVYEHLRPRYVPPRNGEGAPLVRLDGGADLDSSLDELARAMLG